MFFLQRKKQKDLTVLEKVHSILKDLKDEGCKLVVLLDKEAIPIYSCSYDNLFNEENAQDFLKLFLNSTSLLKEIFKSLSYSGDDVSISISYGPLKIWIAESDTYYLVSIINNNRNIKSLERKLFKKLEKLEKLSLIENYQY